MIRLVVLFSLLPAGAFAQTYIATEANKPCPPNSVPVMLQNGRWVCAVAATLTPVENPIPKDTKERK